VERNRDLEARIRRGQQNEFLNVGSGGEACFTTPVASSRSFAHGNISVAKTRTYRTRFLPCVYSVIRPRGRTHVIGAVPTTQFVRVGDRTHRVKRRCESQGIDRSCLRSNIVSAMDGIVSSPLPQRRRVVDRPMLEQPPPFCRRIGEQPCRLARRRSKIHSPRNIEPVRTPPPGMVFSFMAGAKMTHPRRDYEQRLY
jgi:hypothetical protein